MSVEYRLAPDHPDPAPVEDCYAGPVWMAKNAAELGIDPERLLIAGVSGGGGLAAGTALLARDRAFPKLSHQILICPMLDDRVETHGSRMVDRDGVWDRYSNLYAWTSLLGERRGGPVVSQYAAPARAEDLSRLPRTYIDTGSAEGFRDEILIYAGRLSEAGVSVDLHMWGGGFHSFDMAAVMRLSRAPPARPARSSSGGHLMLDRRAHAADVALTEADLAAIREILPTGGFGPRYAEQHAPQLGLTHSK